MRFIWKNPFFLLVFTIWQLLPLSPVYGTVFAFPALLAYPYFDFFVLFSFLYQSKDMSILGKFFFMPHF